MPENYEQYFGTSFATVVEELLAEDGPPNDKRFAVRITHAGERPYTIGSYDTVFQAIDEAGLRIDRFERLGETKVKVEILDRQHAEAELRTTER